MDFRIADTFTDSLGKLTAQEQKAVKMTAFDLQLDPSSPGMSFHKINGKDPSFWSVRVNRDIRLIVHKTASSILLCYADHHDPAYKWAERRRIERHPTTGAMQMVVVPERHELPISFSARMAEPESWSARSVPDRPPKQRPFDNLRKGELMAFGVPAEWVDEVRKADEDSLLDVISDLPQEAQESLLKLAVGERPEPAAVSAADMDPFHHPDAQRRFRLLDNAEELELALDYPWEKWTVFLHPTQRAFVERDYGGPARVSGSAGTGKTVVALHRAAFLTRKHPEARILLTTFSRTLANALGIKLDRLVGRDTPLRRRIAVHPIKGIGHDLYAGLFGQPNMASASAIRSAIEAAAERAGPHAFTLPFLMVEWRDVVDAWQITAWDDYRDVQRLGRRTRLGIKQREALWAIFEDVRTQLAERKLVTWAGLFARLTGHYRSGKERPFDYAVIDEAQDIGIAELKFLAALGGERPDSLFFAGDLGQRIFQQPFSWKSLGVDIRGRSHTLKVNYRTSHQIRSQADRLLPAEITDVDGTIEKRGGTVSVFNGPPPLVRVCSDETEEQGAVSDWIGKRLEEGLSPQEIGVFVRSADQLKRARAAVKAAGAQTVDITDKMETFAGQVAVGTMHLAKGLEFRAVAVMACDDEVLPLQSRIDPVSDESDLEEVYNTERHLLYVACTRARDHLLVTGIEPASEFLDDLSSRAVQ